MANDASLITYVREVPVQREADVVVIGGGSAGLQRGGRRGTGRLSCDLDRALRLPGRHEYRGARYVLRFFSPPGPSRGALWAAFQWKS